MRSPLDEGPWLILDTVVSTQDEAAARLGSTDCPGIVFAWHQEGGRGRFGRAWQSERGVSLTMSFVYRGYKGHARPWLIGMAVSLAVARAIGGRVRWPNDVAIEGKKVAGVLTELFEGVPVIGIGANLDGFAGEALPSAGTAKFADAKALADAIVREIERLPEPSTWNDLSAVWRSLDDTPGKSYRLPTGELAVALRVGNDGALVCTVDGQERTAMAAEAILGS